MWKKRQSTEVSAGGIAQFRLRRIREYWMINPKYIYTIYGFYANKIWMAMRKMILWAMLCVHINIHMVWNWEKKLSIVWVFEITIFSVSLRVVFCFYSYFLSFCSRYYRMRFQCDTLSEFCAEKIYLKTGATVR